jgi:hypothetical protein
MRVVSTSSLRVVRRHFRRIYKKGGTQIVGNDYFACAGRQGRAHRIASVGSEYLYPGTTHTSPVDSSAAFIRQTAGPFLILSTQVANLTGDFAEKTGQVVNAATGHRYTFFHGLTSPGPARSATGSPVAIRLNARGQLAGIFGNSGSGEFQYSSPPVGQSVVVAFNAHGVRTVLDQAPRSQLPGASLRLTGSVVSWTHAGAPRSATIR